MYRSRKRCVEETHEKETHVIIYITWLDLFVLVLFVGIVCGLLLGVLCFVLSIII